MNQNNPTRRDALKTAIGLGAAALATATPLALAAAVPQVQAAHPFDDMCDCRSCRAEDRRRGCHPLMVNVLLTAAAAKAALDRLISTHCKVWECDLCLDASGCRYSVEDVIRFMEGDIGGWDGFDGRYKRASVPSAKLPAHPAALIALYDHLDALYDLTTWQTEKWASGARNDCDHVAYHVGIGVHNLHGERFDSIETFLLVEQRELAFAERKVERERQLEDRGGEFMPHTANAHLSAEDDVRFIRAGIDAITKGVAIGKSR